MRLLRVQHLVLAHRVRDDQLHGRLRADQPRRELRRAPGRDEAEQAFGRRDVPDLVGDHAVVAVQRELDASAEDAAVDRGHGRVRKLADACEEVVSRAAALDRLLAGLDARELVEIGAAGEAPRLAGDDEGREAALLELGQKPRERLERAAAEDVRPARARPVVHRHERHRVAPVEVELGHRLAHGTEVIFRQVADWDEHARPGGVPLRGRRGAAARAIPTRGSDS